MDWQNYIHSDPEILLGKPVIIGTRVSVDFVLGLFANGWSKEQVLENYQGIALDALQAVFAFAAECMRELRWEGKFTIIERGRIRQRPLPQR
jgi:uncharacterized protein (DUF433 family)